jgi:hypothetical protein
MLAATQLAVNYLGRAGVNALAAIMGVTDVDPFITGMTQAAGTLAPLRVAAAAVTIAAASNNLMKGIYAYCLLPIAWPTAGREWRPSVFWLAWRPLGFSPSSGPVNRNVPNPSTIPTKQNTIRKKRLHREVLRFCCTHVSFDFENGTIADLAPSRSRSSARSVSPRRAGR